MRAVDTLCEFYNPEDDLLGVTDFDDSRRPRLTFHHLHRMRVAKDVEQVDRAEHNDFLPTMYSPAAEGEGGEL